MSERGGIRRLFRIRRVERDIAEELGFHFDSTVEELVRNGWRRDAAEREAHRRFGVEWWYRRELTRIDRGAAIRQWLVDRVRGVKDAAGQVLSSLRRSPGLSASIVAALALGIGVNGTMLRIIDRLWLSPPAHIEAPDEVVRLLADRLDPFSGRRYAAAAFSYPGYQDLLAARGFSDVAATTAREVTLGHGVGAEEATAVLATGNYFRMLGVRAAIGRLFNDENDIAGVAPVVVLSYGYWRRAFGGSAAVVGETIDFGHGPHEIIGVAPRYFTGADLDRVDMWLPLRAAIPVFHGGSFLTQALMGRRYYWLTVQARVASGVTPSTAAAEATALHRAGYREEVARGDYDAEAAIVSASLTAARGPLVHREMDVARWLAIVALLVLLIACVNVTNLLLARMIRDRHEVGIRLALGVPRSRLVGQLMLEGLVLAAVGGGLAIGFAHFTAPWLGARLLPNVDWGASATGMRVVALTAGIAAFAGLLAALPPAIQMTRRTVMDALSGSAVGGATRSTTRLRSALVLAQATMSVLLLVGAALFVRSLNNARSADLGYDPDNVFIVSPRFVPGSTTETERAGYFRAAPGRIERLPGIAAAGTAATTPFAGVVMDEVRVPGSGFEHAPNGGMAYLHSVSPGYFDALRLRILEGRAFDAKDRDGAPLVAMINHTLARSGWPDGRALASCVEIREVCLTVVGVVADPYFSSLEPTERFQVWWPAAQEFLMAPNRLLVRSRSDRAVDDVAQLIRRELIAMDSRVRFVEVETLHEVMSRVVTRSWELGATLFSAFGALALLLAALGLYSVLAFDVAQRTRELGVRVALGATRPRLMRGVIIRGFRVTAAGVAIGLVLAWLLTPRLADLLFGVSPRDIISYGGAAIALLLVALVASAVPARTAIRADPVQALRSE